jgi:hypothetical protein
MAASWPATQILWSSRSTTDLVFLVSNFTPALHLREETVTMFCLPDIISAIKSRKMRSAKHVARMDISTWKKEAFVDLGIDRTLLLKWILK